MKRFNLVRDPATLKRLLRFRRRRRAFWSLWLLIALFAVSLCSELICNDRPLYVRFEGRSFFPVFRFYPEDVFAANGKQTRPDYKSLNRAAAFRGKEGNFMLFPPVPYGPFESIDPDEIQPEDRVELSLAPIPQVCRLDVRRDFTVVRAVAAGFFFGTADANVPGLVLTEHWSLTPKIMRAVESRLANRASPALAARVFAARNPGRSARLSLSPFSPRSRPPQTVRIILRQPMEGAARKHSFLLDSGPAILKGDVSTWNGLAEPARRTLEEYVARAFEEPVFPPPLVSGDRKYQIDVRKDDVSWPHAPVRGHWLGIDSAGRDVLARILYGLRISMVFGFLLVAGSMIVGTVIGAVQGYYGGKVDITGQRLIEVWSAMPFLYVMILMGSIYGRGFALLLLCYGIFNWIGISYYIRGEFLKLRRQPFVDSARCMGISPHKIMLRHILPNALTPLITFLPFSLVGAIGALAALDYLGFGLPPPTPSWGQLLHQAQQFRWAWWLSLYPSLSLFAVMLLTVFVGEGVRDAYDPRPFSRME